MADEVIDFYEEYAKPLDEWQKLVLTHGLGVNNAREWAAFKVACWVARQNGKGGIIEALELAWLFLPGMQQRLITHSAHQYRTAREAFIRLKEIIEGSDYLSRRLARNGIREANGEQGIELASGQRLLFLARSRTGGRGFSAPKVVLDEAQELQALMMASALPTMSAQPNPQVWFFGTPPDDPAAWCYNLKRDGEEGTDDLAWFDWGRELDLTDPDDLARVRDPDEWYAANPALGIRITEKWVRSELKPSGLGATFPHERLGVWRPEAAGASGVIEAARWRELADPSSDRAPDVALAVDINPARTHAAIVAAGRREIDGAVLVSVVDYRPGTDWIVERLCELVDEHDPVAVAVDVASPARTLLDQLADEGIKPPVEYVGVPVPERGDLAAAQAREVAVAFGLFVDAARQGTMRHLDDTPLSSALAGAGTRSLVGGMAWDRKGGTDICPLVAATLAHWAYVTLVDQVEAADYDPTESVY